MIEKVVVALILIPISILTEGAAVSHLWSWFITPLGVPTMGIAQGAGVTLLANLVTLRVSLSTDKTLSANQLLMMSIIASLWSWGMGFVIHLFM